MGTNKALKLQLAAWGVMTLTLLAVTVASTLELRVLVASSVGYTPWQALRLVASVFVLCASFIAFALTAYELDKRKKAAE